MGDDTAPPAGDRCEVRRRPIFAVQHLRRMRGGSQSHLMRCSDGKLYVVKFMNNPQGVRILANELIGSRLAQLLGLPVAKGEIITVDAALIRSSEEMVVEFVRSRRPCQAGLCFGSACRIDCSLLYDFLPKEQFCQVQNLSDFWGMLVFDLWTCNTDWRQAVFIREAKCQGYQAVMIDQGGCFNGSVWNFPDAPLRGLYYDQAAYDGVTGIDSFGPWLDRLESEIDQKVLEECAADLPLMWLGPDNGSLRRLLDRLDARRQRVRELLRAARDTSPLRFPRWQSVHFRARGVLQQTAVLPRCAI